MSARSRAGLVSRIRQIRSALPSEPNPAQSQVNEVSGPLQALETRVRHLETLVQGLQDSVYREAQRESRRITELEARIEPSALAASLSKDARERGL